jgi:hypothetical protein
MRAVARSPDRRTNVWEITPDCGHKPFVPGTTLMASQHVECPKCGRGWWVNYNTGTMVRADG